MVEEKPNVWVVYMTMELMGENLDDFLRGYAKPLPVGVRNR